MWLSSGVSRNFFLGGVGSTNSDENREQRQRGSGGGSPLVRGSRGRCDLVQEISFHIVKLGLFMMTTNLFVIANVKQLRIWVVLEFCCLFFRTSWSVSVLNSAIFNSFHNRVEFGTILVGLRNFGGGGLNPPNPPSVYHWCLVTSMLRHVTPEVLRCSYRAYFCSQCINHQLNLITYNHHHQ